MFVYLRKKPLKIIWKKASTCAPSVEKIGVSTLTPESFVYIKPVNFKQKEITSFLALLVQRCLICFFYSSLSLFFFFQILKSYLIQKSTNMPTKLG